MNSLDNPFSSIKANDLNHKEINEQWVDLSNEGFKEYFKIRSNNNQIVEGAKGTGKTHILRYFSYQSQIDRAKESVLSTIKEEGFFAIYFLASGLDSSRFDDLPFENKINRSYFRYYLELWIAGLVINAIIEISQKEILLKNENSFVKSVASLFIEPNGNLSTLIELLDYINSLVSQVNYFVANAPTDFITDKVVFPKICVVSSSLISKIPEIFKMHSNGLQDVNFVYLVDEFENLNSEMQQHFNTLLREKLNTYSFRIGCRPNGFLTFKTLGGGEPNREGHEFSLINLDSLIGENDFENFAINLILNRLRYGNIIDDRIFESLKMFSKKKKMKFISKYFEEFNICDLIEESTSRELLSGFTRRLSKYYDDDFVSLLSERIYSDEPFSQLASIHLFCQFWSGKSNLSVGQLLEYAKVIREELDIHVTGESKLIKNKINYYSNNYQSVILRAIKGNVSHQYCGFQNIVNISKGFPRYLLTILRNVYTNTLFDGEKPFGRDSVFSIDIQRTSILEASEWLLNEVVVESSNKITVSFIHRMATIFREELFSDKPIECSCSSFEVDIGGLSEISMNIINGCVNSRILLTSSTRQERNSQKVNYILSLNPLLLPKFGLPVSRRGTMHFKSSEIDNDILSSDETVFDEFVRKFKESRNAPFLNKINDSQLGLGI